MLADASMIGEVKVWVSSEGDNSERRIYVSITGLPGWVLGMLRDAAPLRNSGSTYDSSRIDKSGPTSVQLRADRVFIAAEPTPPASDDAPSPDQSSDAPKENQ